MNRRHFLASLATGMAAAPGVVKAIVAAPAVNYVYFDGVSDYMKTAPFIVEGVYYNQVLSPDQVLVLDAHLAKKLFPTPSA